MFNKVDDLEQCAISKASNAVDLYQNFTDSEKYYGVYFRDKSTPFVYTGKILQTRYI